MIKRTERITVRFTAKEEEWIITKSEEHGVSKSRYIRQVALCQRPQAEDPFSEADRPIQLEDAITKQRLEQVLIQQLPKLGNNLNQLARHVNTQQSIGPKQTEELARCRKDLDELTLTIIEALA